MSQLCACMLVLSQVYIQKVKHLEYEHKNNANAVDKYGTKSRLIETEHHRKRVQALIQQKRASKKAIIDLESSQAQQVLQLRQVWYGKACMHVCAIVLLLFFFAIALINLPLLLILYVPNTVAREEFAEVTRKIRNQSRTTRTQLRGEADRFDRRFGVAAQGGNPRNGRKKEPPHQRFDEKPPESFRPNQRLLQRNYHWEFEAHQGTQGLTTPLAK